MASVVWIDRPPLYKTLPQQLLRSIGRRAITVPRWLRALHICRRYRSYTMVPLRSYCANLMLCAALSPPRGLIVECGVWRGGMSAGIADMLPGRTHYLFDSFEGLPPATALDGEVAKRWQEDERRRRHANEGVIAMQQTLTWLKTWTAAWVLAAIVAAFVLGVILRLLVRKSSIHPSHALRVIESISVVVGGAAGSVLVLLLLIILWPAAGNWVINTFLSDTTIWQTEFQQWITQKIDDPTTSSAIGLLIQRVQFGSAFLGFLSGWGTKWLLEKVMGKQYHARLSVGGRASV